MSPPEIATPFAAVDRERLERNIAAMAGRLAELGVALRPHAKTHKCPEIARLQVAAGANGLTVATLGEALAFAERGLDDLFVAYPLWLDAPRRRLLDAVLATGARVGLGCDSAESAARLAPVAGQVDVLVEVDSGHHRSGVSPAEVRALAKAVLDRGLSVRGAFTFPGHSYSPDGRRTAALDETEALARAGTALRELGIADPVLSGGSTPSIGHLRAGASTEARPGVYVFGDAQQWELGSCSADEIAFTVHATVVSSRPGQIVLDSGSKALGADRAAWATGYGRLLDHPDARIVQLSEHHAVVTWPGASPQPRLGSRLRVVPNHVCNAANLADELLVLDADGRVEAWPVAARGRNA